MVRNSREEWKTYQGVFDKFTERLLFKLSSQQQFDELTSIISPGKEAVVFIASKKQENVAVKIYKLETAKFSKMYSYIRVDPRYNKLQNRQRQVIFAWCEREYRNLLLAREAGLPVPVPFAHKDNVIVMEFIGNNNFASPLLNHAAPEDPEEFMEQVFDGIIKLGKAGFFHGDLSEHNIINHNEQPVFIDFSHMGPISSSNGQELLERDVKTVCRYAKKVGVDITHEEILKKIEKKE